MVSFLQCTEIDSFNVIIFIDSQINGILSTEEEHLPTILCWAVACFDLKHLEGIRKLSEQFCLCPESKLIFKKNKKTRHMSIKLHKREMQLEEIEGEI